MVVMVAWKGSSLGKGRLLKTSVSLSKAAMKEAAINPEDVALILHAGIYRQHFRTEPAFATHLQGELGIKCTMLDGASRHCFAFDVSDGSCSPHVGMDCIEDLLAQVDGKYAILCVGDERPNKQTEWNHNPYCFIAIFALDGDGPRLMKVEYDDSNLSMDTFTRTHFDSKKKANIAIEYGPNAANKGALKGMIFDGSPLWLSGQHMYEFHSQLEKEGRLIHRIVDRTGKTTSAHWER